MSFQVDRVPLGFLTVNSILAGGLLGGAAMKWGPQLFAGLPELLWIAIGFVAVVVPLYPVIDIWKQARTGEALSLVRYLSGVLVGAVITPAIYYLL